MRLCLCFSACFILLYLCKPVLQPTLVDSIKPSPVLVLQNILIWIWAFTRHNLEYWIFTQKSQLKGTDYPNLELTTLAQKVLYLPVKMDLAAILIGRGRGMDQFLQEECCRSISKCQNNGWPILMPIPQGLHKQLIFLNFYKQLHMSYTRNVSDLSA